MDGWCPHKKGETMFKKDVEISDFEKELKRRRRKEAIENGWNKFATGIRDNKDVLVFVVPSAVAVLSGGAKVLSKTIAAHSTDREIKFKERNIYDRSQGRYVPLKRPLRTHEALELERRRRNGEGLNAILYDMGLLK
jgi:hypothetical protein